METLFYGLQMEINSNKICKVFMSFSQLNAKDIIAGSLWPTATTGTRISIVKQGSC